MLKLILKLWPALIPIVLYLLWVYLIKKIIIKRIIKKDKIIDVEKKVGQSSTQDEVDENFTLKNKNFLIVIYISLILIILSFINLAIN